MLNGYNVYCLNASKEFTLKQKYVEFFFSIINPSIKLFPIIFYELNSKWNRDEFKIRIKNL